MVVHLFWRHKQRIHVDVAVHVRLVAVAVDGVDLNERRQGRARVLLPADVPKRVVAHIRVHQIIVDLHARLVTLNDVVPHHRRRQVAHLDAVVAVAVEINVLFNTLPPAWFVSSKPRPGVTSKFRSTVTLVLLK